MELSVLFERLGSRLAGPPCEQWNQWLASL